LRETSHHQQTREEMNFKNIKIWLIDLNEYTIKEIKIPEIEFSRKKYLENSDLFYSPTNMNMYFQLTEESANASLRKYIQKSIDMKQKEIETLKNHLSNI
jgi:hypothetical protein